MKRNFSYKIHGTCKPGFEAVQKAYEYQFEAGYDKNSQLCVYVGDEKVIDLYGNSDKPKSPNHASYDAESLQCVFSNSKTISAICVALIKEKGYLDYDEKVSTYWPEFAQNGKENVIISDILRHQANMHVLPELIELGWGLPHNIKLNKIGKVIEDMPLCTLPFGAKRAYHANSKDWIMNEIFRRVEPEGRTMGEYWREEVKE